VIEDSDTHIVREATIAGDRRSRELLEQGSL
jgi:hypothetical protein